MWSEIRICSLAAAAVFALPILAAAQSGHTYNFERIVLPSGGARSSGGTLVLDTTFGIPVAGPAAASPYTLEIGFWNPQTVRPFARGEVSGRVTTPEGTGLRNALVILTDKSGIIKTTLTGSFGFYSFPDVPVDATYVIRVESKRFSFKEKSVKVEQALSDLNFTAEP
ncbi:MAG: carboxypeptidase-like regulatory domain-containing protein [Acidobacteria bacterium]|nr:carboxypeptidase-like regulatory domain-containing protein [Acidobacteriota bacterium]